MTEEEHKELFCSQSLGLERKRHCITSKCSAWRVQYLRQETKSEQVTPCGYCGLAGEPKDDLKTEYYTEEDNG